MSFSQHVTRGGIYALLIIIINPIIIKFGWLPHSIISGFEDIPIIFFCAILASMIGYKFWH